MQPSRTAWLLSILLLVLGALRITWIVGHQPVLGYAYQFDTALVPACIGLWPDLPESQRYTAQREAPVAQYGEGPRRPADCALSSELVFASVAVAAWKVATEAELASPRTMDLRFVGAVKAITLIVLALVLTIALRERPPWMVANAAVFGIVLADPMVTLWMNSLHTEFSAALFCYAAIGCLVVITGVAPERTGWYLAFALALTGLGFSRTQHALLPIGLALLALPVAWRYRPLAGILVIVVTAGVAVIQTAVVTHAQTVRAAHSVDVVLGMLLPASRVPDRALAALQLPERCESVIGATSTSTMGESIIARCPEAQTLRAARIASLLVSEPAIGFRVMARAAPLTQPALIHHLGIEAGRRFGKLDEQQSPLARSIAEFTERVPLVVQVGWLMFLFAALAIAAIAWAFDGITWGTSIGPLITASLAGTAVHVLLAAVFGTGLVDLTRNIHLSIVASHALLTISIIAAFVGFIPRRTQRVVAGSIVGRSTSLLFVLSLLGAILAIAMSSVIWFPAYRAQSLAIGAVEEPSGNRLASRQALLRGWVLDPLASPRVHAVVNGSTRVESRPSRHSADPNGIELARMFPGYRDPVNARFEIPIDVGQLPGKAVSVKTYAVNPDGTTTEIDRRTLIPPSR